MKITINHKRYDTNRCEELGSIRHYNHSNTYSGTTSLMRASDGQLIVWTDSNGQDCWLTDNIVAFEDCEDMSIDDFDMTDEQEARCEELGLITVVK